MKLSHWGRVLGPVGFVLLLASVLTIAIAGDTRLGFVNIALGLVCVAFYLATNFGELASKATGRGAFYSLTSVVATAVVLVGLGAANYLAFKHPKSWDLTKDKIHTLSDDTQKTVKGLTQPLEVIAFFKAGEPLVQPWEALLDRYHDLNPKLTYRVVDPEKEPELVKQAGLTRGGPRVVVQEGKLSVKVDKPTEEDLTNALVKVTHETQKTIYFLEGHGEAAIDDHTPGGLEQLADSMANEGMKAKKLPFGDGKIPDDAAAVVIAGPQKALLASEVAGLRTYLNQGGRVLAMVEPLTPSGLEPLFKDWGISVDNGVIVDQVGRSKFESPFAAVGAAYGDSPAVKAFSQSKMITVFPQAASLTVAPVKGVNASPLVYTLGPVNGMAVSWVESGAQASDTPGAQAKQGPLTVAAVATQAEATGTHSHEGRLLVVGDHDFASNGNLSVLGNSDFALNALNYLVGQTERLSIRPRQRAASRLFLTASQMSGIRFFATELPIGLLALGLAIFFNRRAK